MSEGAERRLLDPQAHVLVVEDDGEMRSLVARLLRDASMLVSTARDGREMWDVLERPSGPPDLVLLDVMLPGATGLDLLRRLRERSRVPGLMLTASGPKVLEFNCRWGDPETQVLVRRLESDLLPLLEATAAGALSSLTPAWDEKAAVCVILASGGYPGSYEKGKAISGLVDAATLDSVEVFHAGTKATGDDILTNGGRVLGVTAKADTLEDARNLAYQAADRISFEGVQRRNDIGATPTH